MFRYIQILTNSRHFFCPKDYSNYFKLIPLTTVCYSLRSVLLVSNLPKYGYIYV